MPRKPYKSPEIVVYGTVSNLTLDCFTAPGKLPTGDDKCGNRSRIESLDGPANPKGR